MPLFGPMSPRGFRRRGRRRGLIVGAAVGSHMANKRNQAQLDEEMSAGGEDPVAQLKELAELRDQGILTQAEFDAEKAKILGQ